MGSTLQRWFWLVQLLLVLTVGALAGMTVSNLVEATVSPLLVTPPPPPEPPTERASTSTRQTLAMTSARWEDPEPAPRPKPKPEPKPKEEEDDGPALPPGEYPASELQVALTGTFVSSDPTLSLALFVDGKTKAGYTLAPGQVIPGTNARLLRIDRSRVVLEHEEEVEQIDLTDDPRKARRSRASTRQARIRARQKRIRERRKRRASQRAKRRR